MEYYRVNKKNVLQPHAITQINLPDEILGELHWMQKRAYTYHDFFYKKFKTRSNKMQTFLYCRG